MYPHALQERNDACNKRKVNAWTGHDMLPHAHWMETTEIE